MTTAQDAPLTALVVLFTPGDTTEAYQDLNTFAPAPAKLTPLGSAESHNLGVHLRHTYLSSSAPSPLHGLEAPNGLVDASRVRVRTSIREAAYGSALAVLQGAFPPRSENAIVLANGTRVQAPLGGYQYVPVETVERETDHSSEPWVDCPTFEKHISSVRASSAYAQRVHVTAPFFQHIQRFVPFPASLINIWDVHEYIRAELVHNQTYAYRLEPTLDSQARHLASVEQAELFSHPEPVHIANIAGRTALRPLLDALEAMAFDPGDQTRLVLEGGSYHHLFGLLSLLHAPDADPSLLSLPDSASALLLELRTKRSDGRAFVRLHWWNGTAPARPVHAFGHEGDIALTELLYRAKRYAIADEKEWAAVCGRGRFRALGRREGEVLGAGVLAVMILIIGWVFTRRRRRTTCDGAYYEKA